MAHEPLESIINLLEFDESEARDFESNRPRFGSIRLKIRSKSSKNSGSVVSPRAHAYIDDVVIASQTLEDHIHHLRTVFSVFSSVGISVNPSKAFISFP